jgi:hypothetical protein
MNEISSTRVLTQEEIDSLLCYRDGSRPLTPDEHVLIHGFYYHPNIAEQVIARLLDPDPPEERGVRYGIFEPDRSMVPYFDDPTAENALSDLRALNASVGQPPIYIGGTSIELMNFSKCPHCSELHSSDDLMAAYAAPVRRPGVGLHHQMRRDTCISCQNCGTRFQPTIVIIDQSPVAERQFLCRCQTVEAVRDYTRARNGIASLLHSVPAPAAKAGSWMINDVDINDLMERPTLIVNMAQYSPAALALRFMTGANMGADDVLFGEEAW